MDWWEVIDSSGWAEVVYESRGKRDKYWVIDASNTQWLRKSPRASRPNEPAIEAFTLELARLCGFEVAYGRVTEWAVDGARRRGFLSRKFHDELETQYTGAELLAGFDVDSRDIRVSATLARIRGALGDNDLLEQLLRTLLFDAWIGNADRHLQNWAVLERVGDHARRFAPMFDTAGSLGSELLEDHRLLSTDCLDADIEAYARACKSGFGDGARRPGIAQTEVLEEIRAWPCWTAVYNDLFPRFVDVEQHDVPRLLAEIPNEWWSEARRTFARRLLRTRVTLLSGAAP